MHSGCELYCSFWLFIHNGLALDFSRRTDTKSDPMAWHRQNTVEALQSRMQSASDTNGHNMPKLWHHCEIWVHRGKEQVFSWQNSNYSVQAKWTLWLCGHKDHCSGFCVNLRLIHPERTSQYFFNDWIQGKEKQFTTQYIRSKTDTECEICNVISQGCF